MYKAYFAPAGSGTPAPLEKEWWPFRSFASLPEALIWAERAAKDGSAVLSIEGDDGTLLSRSDIAVRIGHPGSSSL
jgi:hypothetical protein